MAVTSLTTEAPRTLQQFFFIVLEDIEAPSAWYPDFSNLDSMGACIFAFESIWLEWSIVSSTIDDRDFDRFAQQRLSLEESTVYRYYVKTEESDYLE